MTDNAKAPTDRTTGSTIFSIIFAVIIVGFFCLFTSLGIWQVERLGWKTNLIQRVNERAHLAAAAAPPKAGWADITAEKDEYLPVTIKGKFLNDKEILVAALTDYGTGYWLMVPLQSSDGSITFINRGFVPSDFYDADKRRAGAVKGDTSVTGLLRLDEGHGFWPRNNDPQENRWYTRELPVMANKLGLSDVAPYFIDADKTPNAGGIPVGGLTVVSFRNAHLSYAITWFTLAAGVFAAGVFVVISGRKKKKKI